MTARRDHVAYRGAVLTPLASGGLEHHDDALLVVDRGSGRVVRVAAFTGARPDDVSVVHDLRPALIVPGFVDAHVHYPQTRVVGSASGPLLDWLTTTVFPEEARFVEPSYARAVAQEFVAACAANGTTTVGAYASSDPGATHVLFEELRAAGLRAVAGLVLMDQDCPEALRVPAERALAATRELAAAHHGADGGLVHLAVVPRFALSCSRALLEGAAALANELGLVVMTHVSENPAEGEATLRAHPVASDYLGVYEAYGLVGARTLLAHAIHFSPSEWDRVAAAGARIAHCPDSNFFLGSGSMRLADATARGVVVGLGSDVAAGRSFSLRRAISHAYDASLVVGAPAAPEALFALATLGGARALGLDATVGSLEPGKDADFAVLALPTHATGRADALRHATFAADAAPVVRTFVRGRETYRAPVAR